MPDLNDAVKQQDVARLKTLLSQDVDQTDIGFAIQTAVSGGNLAILELINAHPALSTSYRCIGLMQAVRENKADVVDLLLTGRIKLTYHGMKNETPLTLAVSNANKVIVAKLLEAGFDPNFYAKRHTGDQKMPLILAIQTGDVGLVQQLLDAGADANQLTRDKKFPLDIALATGNSDVVAALKAAGARQRQTSDLNFVAAAGEGELARVEETLATATGHEPGTALSMAAQKGHAAVVAFLTKQTVHELTAENLQRALALASQNGHAETVQLLLDAGAKPNKRDSLIGRTPLHAAAGQNRVAVMKVLLANKGKIEVGTSGDGDTPLLIASGAGHVEMVQYLLAAGAEVNGASRIGETPLAAAKRRSQTAVIEILEAAGGKLESRDYLLEQVRKELKEWRRDAFLPKVKGKVRSVASAGSRFGGHPFLQTDESWPHCPETGDPLTFFWQLNLDDWPARAAEQKPADTGLIQFFCNTHKLPIKPFENRMLVRLLTDIDNGTVGQPPTNVLTFPTQHIKGWRRAIDYPFGEDLAINTHRQLLADVHAGGDKLLGWPTWIQDPVYPTCPESGQPMQFLFQIESQNKVPWDWGDGGVGHIFQSPTHPAILTFAWQSY